MLPEVKLSIASFALALVTNCWILDPSLPLLSLSIALLPTLGVKFAELACLWNLDATQKLNSVTAYCLGLSSSVGSIFNPPLASTSAFWPSSTSLSMWPPAWATPGIYPLTVTW